MWVILFILLGLIAWGIWWIVIDVRAILDNYLY